ncbi:MAG: AraC family transcriptional regulator [Sedimentisphaerales bacterium]|nr:AraC family transcriptional regulator [Sedimentisphaerales bacterium]
MTEQPILDDQIFSKVDWPLVLEALFDCIADVVFFIKNSRGGYVVVNQTMVDRCGKKDKAQIIGRRAEEVFPAPLGQSYSEQDRTVLQTGQPILNQLELQVYLSGGTGWCLTHKLPLRDQGGKVIGLVGISKDLHAPSEKGEDYRALADVVGYIQEHYGEPLKVQDLANLAGLSTYQLEQRFKKVFQITAGQFIQKVRMDVAVKRLRQTNDPISRVALDCGYCDQSAFTRQFRQTVGISPAQYRRSVRSAGSPGYRD